MLQFLRAIKPMPLTTGFIVFHALYFFAQVFFPVLPWTGFLQSDISTLIAFGGIFRGMFDFPILAESALYRFLTAGFVHGDFIHFILNMLCLYMAGGIVEVFFGRLWYVVVYFLAILAGAIFSLIFNAPETVSVGASGGIMGLLAANIMMAKFRLYDPKGHLRNAIFRENLSILIPSLLPFIGELTSGHAVDLSAHFGGAIGGSLVAGFIFFVFWPKVDLRPKGKWFSGIIALGLILFAAQGIHILSSQYSVIKKDFLQHNN